MHARKTYRTSMLFALAPVAALILAAPAAAHGKKKPPVLEDAGSFYVNGETVTTDYPDASGTAPGRIVVNQMYVEYMVPEKKKKGAYPIIMEHGSGHTGKTYGQTPDGREGWASYFVRNGYTVYVVDQVGRARSSFDTTPINQAAATGDASYLPSNGQVRFTYERAWEVFRFGPSPDVFWDNTQFPKEAVDQYMAQLVPNTESTLPDRNIANVNALEALLEQIGPAVVVVHSQSGGDGLGITTRRPDLVRGYIDVEGRSGCTPITEDQIQTLTQVPFLTVIGDHDYPNEPFCRETVAAVNAAGGNATHGVLPNFGFIGNTHMLMMDKNNLKIADWIMKWLEKNVEEKRGHGHGHGPWSGHGPWFKHWPWHGYKQYGHNGRH
jgi:pimeloyl-ACP methyl ester carboxylesterase